MFVRFHFSPPISCCLLVVPSSHLKIADWGLARRLHEMQDRYTTKVITLWYRPPELLLKAALVRRFGNSQRLWCALCPSFRRCHRETKHQNKSRGVETHNDYGLLTLFYTSQNMQPSCSWSVQYALRCVLNDVTPLGVLPCDSHLITDSCYGTLAWLLECWTC